MACTRSLRTARAAPTDEDVATVAASRVASALEANIAGRRCAAVEGFSLHANVRVAANDRDGLEHIVATSGGPLSPRTAYPLADGRVALRFKRPFSEGPRRSCSHRSSSSSDSSRSHASTPFASTASSRRRPATGRWSFQRRRHRHRPERRPDRSRPRGTNSPGPSFCAGSFSSTHSTAPAVTAACASSPPSPTRTPSSASSGTWANTRPRPHRRPSHAANPGSDG